MANNFQLSGSQGNKPTRFSSIFTSRFFTGLWTQRNPFRDAGSSRVEERYVGTRGDSLIDGSNVEINNRLTISRRPGLSVYNVSNFNAIDFFYDFHLFSTSSEQIKVIADTNAALYDATGPGNQNIIWTKSAGAGQTYPLGVGNILFFGNGVDQKKWQNTLTTWIANTGYTLGDGFPQTFIIDPNGSIEQLTACIIPIINVAVDGSNNVTIVSSAPDLTKVLTTNLKVTFSGLGGASFLNGQTVVISSVSIHGFVAPLAVAHAAYGPTADSGLATVVQGGTPFSGVSQPTWSLTLGNTTNDTIGGGTAQWTNRGSTLENWGIVGPLSTEIPAVVTGVGSSGSWQATTFYSNTFVVVDSNGNLQQTTTAGKSGLTTPVWATVIGNTTVDGTATWTVLETAANLTWAAHTHYPAGYFVIGSTGGKSYLFQRQPDGTGGGGVTTSGTLNISLWAVSPGSQGGQYIQSHAAPVAPSATATCNSLLFNALDITNQPMRVTTLNGAGESTSTTALPNPSSSHYNMSVYGSFVVPLSGNYSFKITHQNGFYWGLGPDGGGDVPTKVSGISDNPTGQSVTGVQGYPILGANNNRGPDAPTTDTIVINFPNAGTYPFEVCFSQNDGNQQLTVKCNNFNIPPSGSISGATQPIWPAFSTSFAPKYPSVAEASGQYVWFNLGPTAQDYSWAAKTNYISANPTIVDTNNNIEDPYEAGITGTSPPSVWSTGLNQLTNDNPHLIWINQGAAAQPAPGTVSTVNGGWTYCIALVNTLDNTVSNAGPLSASTGNFFGSTGVTITGGLPANIDPQVDYVAIFRSEDGGATQFLIPGTGNSIYTVSLAQYIASGYKDSTPDEGLNILLEAPVALQNTPPAPGAINLTYHLNRIFFSIGNVVYWTSGSDTPVGNGVNGVGPLNNVTFPSLVKRIVPMPIGALIFTVSDIYLLAGQATNTSPLFAQPFAQGIGLLSYNALAVNGTTIGWFTADSQFLTLDPNSGFSEVGFPIGNLFEMTNWDPANVYVTWHVSGSRDKAWYVSDGQTGWFRLNPTAAPETGLTWSPFATITGGCKAVQSVEVSPGVHKLLVGPAGSTPKPILFRDLTNFSDNGSVYTAFFTVGSVVLAHPGEIAELAFITLDSVGVGTKPTLSLLLDEVSGPFEDLAHFVQDPPILEPSGTVFSQRFYVMEGENPALCRHMQYKVNWVAESIENEILSISLFGGYSVEQ